MKCSLNQKAQRILSWNMKVIYKKSCSPKVFSFKIIIYTFFLIKQYQGMYSEKFFPITAPHLPFQ